MRKIILFLIAVLLFASCSKNRYTITGELKGSTLPTKVYLKLLMGEGEPKVLDSAEVKNGKFTIQGEVDQPEFAILQLANEVVFPVILEKGEVRLAADIDKASEFTITGTLNNQKLAEFRQNDKSYRYKMDSIYQSYVSAQVAGTLTAEQDMSIKNAYDVISKSRMQFVAKFVKDNAGSIAAAAILSQEKYCFEPEKYEELFGVLSKELSGAQVVKTMQKDINILKATSVGSPFIDFKLADVNGKEVSLSSVTNGSKLVLLDFWASWCGPCRAENPNVVKLYEKFKSAGFQIVGISLDEKKERWIEAIKKDHITWIQLSDLKGWKSSAAALYGVTAIPVTYLISGGKIVARDLRGEKLEAKIAELLGAQAGK